MNRPKTMESLLSLFLLPMQNLLCSSNHWTFFKDLIGLAFCCFNLSAAVVGHISLAMLRSLKIWLERK